MLNNNNISSNKERTSKGIEKNNKPHGMKIKIAKLLFSSVRFYQFPPSRHLAKLTSKHEHTKPIPLSAAGSSLPTLPWVKVTGDIRARFACSVVGLWRTCPNRNRKAIQYRAEPLFSLFFCVCFISVCVCVCASTLYYVVMVSYAPFAPSSPQPSSHFLFTFHSSGKESFPQSPPEQQQQQQQFEVSQKTCCSGPNRRWWRTPRAPRTPNQEK